MPTAEKERQVQELEERFKRAKALVITGFRGLSSGDMVEVRRELKRHHLEYRVVKNRLAKLAAARAGIEIEPLLEGPTGICFGYDNPSLAVKLAVAVARRFEQYKIRGGVIEGSLVDAHGVEEWAKLPTREELLARLAGAFQSPIRGLATALGGLWRKLTVALHAIEQQKKKEQTQLDPDPEQEKGASQMSTMTAEQILEAIDGMTVKDLHALVKALEEKYGVSAQAAVAVAAVPAAGAPAGGAAPAAAPTTVKVVLKNAGQQKVQLIKKIKDITGKGLKECKELVDALPAVVKDGLSPEEANQLKAQLEQLGAEVELQ